MQNIIWFDFFLTEKINLWQKVRECFSLEMLDIYEVIRKEFKAGNEIGLKYIDRANYGPPFDDKEELESIYEIYEREFMLSNSSSFMFSGTFVFEKEFSYFKSLHDKCGAEFICIILTREKEKVFQERIAEVENDVEAIIENYKTLEDDFEYKRIKKTLQKVGIENDEDHRSYLRKKKKKEAYQFADFIENWNKRVVEMTKSTTTLVLNKDLPEVQLHESIMHFITTQNEVSL